MPAGDATDVSESQLDWGDEAPASGWLPSPWLVLVLPRFLQCGGPDNFILKPLEALTPKDVPTSCAPSQP